MRAAGKMRTVSASLGCWPAIFRRSNGLLQKSSPLYKRRMQIEEGFRDVKSDHLGFGLNPHRSRCAKRIEILLLIAAFVSYLVFLLGLKAWLSDYEQRFQSNSIERKRALSLVRLGVEYLYLYGQEEESEVSGTKCNT
jgi:hypothetical protein